MWNTGQITPEPWDYFIFHVNKNRFNSKSWRTMRFCSNGISPDKNATTKLEPVYLCSHVSIKGPLFSPSPTSAGVFYTQKESKAFSHDHKLNQCYRISSQRAISGLLWVWALKYGPGNSYPFKSILWLWLCDFSESFWCSDRSCAVNNIWQYFLLCFFPSVFTGHLWVLHPDNLVKSPPTATASRK